MAIENKSMQKLALPVDSPRAARLRCEAAMSDCVNSVLSRYANTLEKKRVVPLQSGSIWDLDPNIQKRVRKNSNSADTNLRLVHVHRSVAENKTAGSGKQENMETESYLNELFPDLPPVCVSSNSLRNDRHRDKAPLKVKTNYDLIPPSFTHVKGRTRRPRLTHFKNKPSFEDWSRQRLQGSKPSREPSSPEKDSESVEKPPAPFERKKLDHLENNYFYGVYEDDSNEDDDASESETAEDEQIHLIETEEHPQTKRLSSVLEYLKQLDLILAVPSAFYGKNMNSTGSRALGTKRFHVGGFKKTLSLNRPFYIKPDGFLTIKISKESIEEKIVLLGMDILTVRKIFPQVFSLIAAINLQGIPVPYSCSAVEVLLRFAFRMTFVITDFEVAMELYKLSCVLQLPELKDNVITYLTDHPISTGDVMKASALADDLSFREMLDCVFVSSDDQPMAEKGVFSFENKCCTLSYSLYTEPQKLKALNIPQAHYNFAGDLSMIRTADVQNHLEIEAVRTVKKVAGLELKFLINKNESAPKVQIFCDVTQGKKCIDMEKQIVLKPLVSFMFEESISVGSESLQINMTVEDIQSSFCFNVEKHVINDEFLRVTLKSNNQNSEKKYLYFISKVLYF